MAQSINQKFFRLGYKKNVWDSIYTNCNSIYFSEYFFKDIYITKIITLLFDYYKTIIYNIKLKLNGDIITITYNVYTLISFNYFIFKILKEKNFKKKLWFIKFLNLNKNYYFKFLLNNMSYLIFNSFRIKKICFIVANASNYSLLSKFSSYYKIKSYKNLKMQLRRYYNATFFKECFQILITFSKLKNSSNLLASYLSLEIKKLKRHNYFLNFLKRALILIIYSKLSKIKGIKILIKGRLHGKPRAKHRLILIGSVPSQSFESKICYSKSTAFSIYGTFGVKVWVCDNVV